MITPEYENNRKTYVSNDWEEFEGVLSKLKCPNLTNTIERIRVSRVEYTYTKSQVDHYSASSHHNG